MTVAARAEPRANQEMASETTYEGVYFLVQDDEHEAKIARAWFRNKFPSAAKGDAKWPKIAREIPMPRLVRNAIIVPLIRREDASPLTKTFRDINGLSHVEHVNPADLIGEIVECKPVRVADHWTDRGDEFDAFGGDLQRPSFLEAMGKSSTPRCPKVHIGNVDVLKLTTL